MARNVAQLSLLKVALFSALAVAASSTVRGNSGSLRAGHALLATASIKHKNGQEPEAAAAPEKPTTAAAAPEETTAEEATPAAVAPAEDAKSAQEVTPADAAPAVATEAVETTEATPEDEDDSTVDHADTTLHHGEDHEHSGSPGKGGGNMVPRSHVHGNETKHEFHWTYAAPQAWSGGYALCDGEAQSPVDIESGAAVAGESGDSIGKRSAYVPLDSRKVHDNGHNVQVNGDFGTLELPDGMYEVKQFHFHFPSEHEVNGRLAAGEIHIVHQKMGSEGTNDLAAVSILLDTEETLAGDYSEKERKKELDFLTNIGFGRRLPKLDEDIAIEGEVDLNAFSKELDGPFFHYKGSLTTPPCSQTVHWYVLEQAATVTAEMIQSFKTIFPAPANNRPVRPLNGRKVMYASAAIAGEFSADDSTKLDHGGVQPKSGSERVAFSFGCIAFFALSLLVAS